MKFAPTYSFVAMLTIAISASNADTAIQAQNPDGTQTKLVAYKPKDKYSVKPEVETTESKQDGVELKRATSRTEATNSSETKLKKMPSEVTNTSQLHIITNHPEATDIKSEVTTNQSQEKYYLEGSNQTMGDNEVTEKDSFISDLLSDYYEQTDDEESDVVMDQTQELEINQPEVKDNVKSQQLPSEMAQTDSEKLESDIIQQEVTDILEPILTTARPKINDSLKSESNMNKTKMSDSLESTQATDQLLAPNNVKSELNMNVYQTNEVKVDAEATDSSDLDHKVNIELNMTTWPQGTNGIESDLSSTAGGKDPKPTTNQTVASLKPIKHRLTLCSRLFKLTRSILFPWRSLFNKLKCALLSPIQDSSTQNLSYLM